jgi:hypothetical protein|tara:strand:+ start:82 stop:270 length:189 start_codon:yes stop_codon:yes gene_type:complete
MKVIDYLRINNRIFNNTEIARLIDVDPATLSRWLKGVKPIGKDYEITLMGVMSKYGYKREQL